MAVKWWRRLPVRIWFLVLATVLVFGLVLEWARWQGERERESRPPSEAVFSGADGRQRTAKVRPMRLPNEKGRRMWALQITTPEGREMMLQWGSAPMDNRFLAALRSPGNARWVLLLFGAAVLAATGWVSWRMTRRLGRLQRDIGRWSAGELAHRADESGGDEAAALAQHFNRAAAQIQTLLHEKDALLRAQKMLLANASHELRAPLNRILNAEALLPGGPENEQWHEDIRNAVRTMDELTEDILDSSRLEAGQDDMDKATETDVLALVIEECVQEDVALKDARGRFWLNPSQESAFGETAFGDGSGALPAPRSFVVLGVERLLRRAVGNLLRNARRYGGSEGVCVTLDTEGGSVVLHVDDSGPGVPEDERDDIFRPFYRTKSASESQGGWGLGLAMVRTIAERHGGSAECSAAPGGGARFTLRLPLCGSGAPAHSA